MKKVVIVLIAVITLFFFHYYGLEKYLTLESLKSNQRDFVNYYEKHQLITTVSFMFVYIVQTAFALPGAAIMSLAAGAIFGPLLGTLLANVSATIGAGISFIITRYLLRDFVLERYGNKLSGINTELELRGLNYLLFLRLVPLFPFFLINLAAGLTKIPFKTFILGTALGIIPGGFVYVNAGASIASIDSVSGILSTQVILSFVLLGLISLVPIAYKKFKEKGWIL